VDVPKAHPDVAVRPTGERYSVPDNLKGIGALADVSGRRALSWLVLEATGGFERPAAIALAASGLPFAVVNPRKARDFVKMKAILAKTDKIDAYASPVSRAAYGVGQNH